MAIRARSREELRGAGDTALAFRGRTERRSLGLSFETDTCGPVLEARQRWSAPNVSQAFTVPDGEPGPEPLHPLLGGAVGPLLGVHPAGRALLDPVVADRARPRRSPRSMSCSVRSRM